MGNFLSNDAKVKTWKTQKTEKNQKCKNVSKSKFSSIHVGLKMWLRM